MQQLTLKMANSIANKYFALLIQKYSECGYQFEIICRKNLSGNHFFMKFSDGTDAKFYEIRHIN